MKDKIAVHSGGVSGGSGIDFDKHQAIIKRGCQALADYLETYYPGLKEMHYSGDSLCSMNGNDFINRFSIGVYIELARAGLIGK